MNPDPHICRLVEHLHKMGPRALLEFLAELGADLSIAHPIEEKLERYRKLTPEMMNGVGVEMPRPPLYEVKK